ncbi:MAG: hypothetical protein DMD67_01650 [Gemmatimonadetes bacterium]|nr:MAG: hypothetical protein DMD67_01650 [Gemmatimonadota bacterium]
MHGDSTVADNTNVDIYVMGPDGSGMRALTTNRGADNTPRYSPDGKWLAYLSMERAGFEADRLRLMIMRRSDGKTESAAPSEITAGWTLSVGSYTWCPDSKCIYAVVEERGRQPFPVESTATLPSARMTRPSSTCTRATRNPPKSGSRGGSCRAIPMPGSRRSTCTRSKSSVSWAR